MDENTGMKYELVFPEGHWEKLQSHLFPGDDDEHGAILATGTSTLEGRVRILVRHVILAVDGVDYVPGQRGYRMLTAEFVTRNALFCRDEKLGYLAVHNHFGSDSVEFSEDDLRSHERGYPALKDITRGQLVGGVVFAKNAVAGDLWLSHGRAEISLARVIGRNFIEMYPKKPKRPIIKDEKYDRQARIFGDRGQDILSTQRVGIVGLGGIGSLVCEYLSRLGVGTLVLIDPDVIAETNIPRVVGSFGSAPDLSDSEKVMDGDLGRYKVDVAAREAKKANPKIVVERHAESVAISKVAKSLVGCDYIFLAADSMQARLVVNAVAQQYLIPSVQLGAKVSVDNLRGTIERIYSVIRPILPSHGCLWCNGLITSDGLQREALTLEEKEAQKYIDEPDIPAPSVITLNALAASHAANDYLFRLMGLRNSKASEDYLYIEPRSTTMRLDLPRFDVNCSECSQHTMSRFARGDGKALPVRN